MLRPIARTGRRLCGAFLLALTLGVAAPLPAVAQSTDFGSFVQSLWPEAQARGVSRATFEEAFRGVSADAKIIALTQKQSEFVRPIWEYVEGAISAQRLERGRQMAKQYEAQFAAAERTYGVPRSVILGIWGMETNFGTFVGDIYVVRALATLAYVGYRGDFFREELLTALQILEQDHVERSRMVGSWAGAMGQTQFMPSSFMKYAVDGNRDGRRDIWSSVPDAIASTANYMREKGGWKRDLPWGFEVELPDHFDFRNLRHGFAAWAGLGLRRADGKPLPKSGEASLFLPGGASGPAFLVTDNYQAIKAYNSSDAYALGVAHLGDRVLGGASIKGRWPAEPMLPKEQRVEVQQRLASLGLYSGEADGRFGSQTREAVRNFQLSRGLVPDGYANQAVLRALRGAR